MPKNLSRTTSIATGAAFGVSLIVLSALVYTRLTVSDPYALLAGQSRLLSDLIAFVHLTVTLALLSCAWRNISTPGKAGAIAGSVGACIAIFVASLVTGIDLPDIIRLYVGRHGWWIVLVTSAFPLLRLRSGVSGSHIGPGWWVTAAASFCAGILIYLISNKGSVDLRFVETLLVLIIPSMCLISIALYYRGRRPAFFRSAASLGAIIAAAVATIR